MSLRIPAIFFNHAEVTKIGTETVFCASLVISGREIERCYMYFSKSAQDALRNYLRIECAVITNEVQKTDVKDKILAEVKDSDI